MLIADTSVGLHHPTSMSWTASVPNPDCSGTSDERRHQGASGACTPALGVHFCTNPAHTLHIDPRVQSFVPNVQDMLSLRMIERMRCHREVCTRIYRNDDERPSLNAVVGRPLFLWPQPVVTLDGARGRAR